MKRSFTYFAMILLVCVSSYLYIKLDVIAEQEREETAWKDELQQVNEQKKAIEENKTEQLTLYESWKHSDKVSSLLYEQSEGKFKREWGLFLTELSQQNDVDPFIVYSLLGVESGNTFDPKIVGPETRFGRAYGMAQFMKNTAPWIAETAHLPYEDHLLFDPLYSIQLSIEYLSLLHSKYDDWNYTLTAYNRGMTGLNKYVTKNGHAKSEYAVTILENANKLRELV